MCVEQKDIKISRVIRDIKISKDNLSLEINPNITMDDLSDCMDDICKLLGIGCHSCRYYNSLSKNPCDLGIKIIYNKDTDLKNGCISYQSR